MVNIDLLFYQLIENFDDIIENCSIYLKIEIDFIKLKLSSDSKIGLKWSNNRMTMSESKFESI